MIPGEYVCAEGHIEFNVSRETQVVQVVNRGDRPVQVGSHFHFFEVNSSLEFQRETTRGFHLDIMPGSAVRFEPGILKSVQLVSFGGERVIFGFKNLVEGPLD